MKKTVSFLLILGILLCLCACGNVKEPEPTEPPETEPPIETPEPVVYDREDGRLIKEVSTNANGLKYLTVYYDYDGQGRVVKEMSMGVNEAPEGYYTNEYDENGNIVLRVSYVALGPEEFFEEYRVTYKYNEAGLCVSETRTQEDAVLSVTEYDYDTNGLKQAERLYQGESFLAAEYSYSYDSQGKVISCIRTDNMEDVTTENRYTYDAKGRIVADLCCDTDGDVLERVENSFDDYGNVLRHSVYAGDGVLKSFTRNEYSYDEAGNVTKCVSSDSEGNSINTTEYTWTYSKG